MTHPWTRLDERLSHPVRFSILALLHHVAKADFSVVREAVGVSDSVLSRHISTLEAADYLIVEKVFVGKRPRTKLLLSKRGREVFAAHLRALNDIVKMAPVLGEGSPSRAPLPEDPQDEVAASGGA